MKLSEEAVEFAKKHITKYYDSDFFPKNDAFIYLWRSWDKIKNYLLSTEIQNFEITIPITLAAPKPNSCFRIVHQLEPLNAIVYTALAFMVADKIELSRMPVSERIACSYRIKTTAEGDFFETKNFYDDFREKSKELSMHYKFILKTDITDFYNQIYVHRLQNAIESADSSLFEISKNIEKFILNLNSSASKGIPVGPAASIIFAEAIMIDVDNFILDKGFEFTRYVDDIRIFCDDEMKLKILLQDLTIYLYENHRLNISAQKTEIKDTFSFFVEDLERPEDKEKQKQHTYLTELTKNFVGSNPYSDSYIPELTMADLSDDNQKKLVIDTLYSLLDEIIQKENFDVSLSKHILKKSKLLRIGAIYPLIIEHFDLFIPVMREVCLYLDAILAEQHVSNKKDFWKQILYRSEARNIAYVKNWLDWLVAKNIECFSDAIFKQYIDTMDFCWQIKTNIKKENISFMKSLKTEYDKHGIWGNIAILQGFSLLAKYERKAYLNSHLQGAKKTEEFLIDAVK